MHYGRKIVLNNRITNTSLRCFTLARASLLSLSLFIILIVRTAQGTVSHSFVASTSSCFRA